MFILDEHLAFNVLKSPLPRRLKFTRLIELRPGEIILDDRVPEVLLTLPQPTFITIDRGFCSPKWCHPRYCILFFAVKTAE